MRLQPLEAVAEPREARAIRVAAAREAAEDQRRVRPALVAADVRVGRGHGVVEFAPRRDGLHLPRCLPATRAR
jgi:hypothetical protein